MEQAPNYRRDRHEIILESPQTEEETKNTSRLQNNNYRAGNGSKIATGMQRAVNLEELYNVSMDQ